MIVPTRMSNVLLDILFSSQFAADNDVLINPTTATAEIVHGGRRLAPTMITNYLNQYNKVSSKAGGTFMCSFKTPTSSASWLKERRLTRDVYGMSPRSSGTVVER